MRLVYVVLSVLPTLAVMALAWLIVRAISVHVVWREAGTRRRDDEPGPSAFSAEPRFSRRS